MNTGWQTTYTFNPSDSYSGRRLGLPGFQEESARAFLWRRLEEERSLHLPD